VRRAGAGGARVLTRGADLMWSDPDDVETWAVSPRGAGWLFGGAVTREVRPRRARAPPALTRAAQFTHTNALTLIARAHQLVQEGYKPMFGGLLVTVWSAPNYVYRSGNKASVLALGADGTRAFKVFDAAPENERERMAGVGARRLVSLRVVRYLRRTAERGCRARCSTLYESRRAARLGGSRMEKDLIGLTRPLRREVHAGRWASHRLVYADEGDRNQMHNIMNVQGSLNFGRPRHAARGPSTIRSAGDRC
jgi:hypothetical protein